MRFALSTQPFCDHRLEPGTLEAIAGAGFAGLEIFGGHAGLETAIGRAQLSASLVEAHLEITAIHGSTRAWHDGRWLSLPSLADSDSSRRQVALAEVERAIELRTDLPFDMLVLHLGVPDTHAEAASANSRDAARRSLERVAEATAAAGLRVALEVQASRLGTVETLVGLVEDDLDAPHVGLCFDFGHAHLSDDVVDALEAASGHIVATHLHDNRGRRDDHLWPFEGTIEWGAALMTLQKQGYEGAYVVTPASVGDGPTAITDLVQRGAAVRQRLFDVLYAI